MTPDLQDSLTFGRMFVVLSEGVTEKLGRDETLFSQGLKDLRNMQAPRREIDEELEQALGEKNGETRSADRGDGSRLLC